MRRKWRFSSFLSAPFHPRIQLPSSLRPQKKCRIRCTLVERLIYIFQTFKNPPWSKKPRAHMIRSIGFYFLGIAESASNTAKHQRTDQLRAWSIAYNSLLLFIREIREREKPSPDKIARERRKRHSSPRLENHTLEISSLFCQTLSFHRFRRYFMDSPKHFKNLSPFLEQKA